MLSSHNTSLLSQPPLKAPRPKNLTHLFLIGCLVNLACLCLSGQRSPTCPEHNVGDCKFSPSGCLTSLIISLKVKAAAAATAAAASVAVAAVVTVAGHFI